jgi:hypothetical protein
VTDLRLSPLSKAHTFSQHRDVENGDANGTAEFLQIALMREDNRIRVATSSILAIVQSTVQPAVDASSAVPFLV